MKPKHLEARIKQALAIAECSSCPRRKFGALLLDPTANVVVSDGYNGPPRGGGTLCGDTLCERDGLRPEDIEVCGDEEDAYLKVKGKMVCLEDGRPLYWMEEAKAFQKRLLVKYPPVLSGTRMEVGCHHAEANVLCNAAATGRATAGTWLIVTGEPCRMCSRFIHHCGVTKVVVIKGGYSGENGIEYLKKHAVEIEYVDGPQDPRTV